MTSEQLIVRYLYLTMVSSSLDSDTPTTAALLRAAIYLVSSTFWEKNIKIQMR